MKTLTDEQRKFIREQIDHELTEAQTETEYRFFTDDITLVWSNSGDAFIALYGNPNRWDVFSPSDIMDFIMTLSDDELLIWASEQIVNLDINDDEFWLDLDAYVEQ